MPDTAPMPATMCGKRKYNKSMKGGKAKSKKNKSMKTKKSKRSNK